MANWLERGWPSRYVSSPHQTFYLNAGTSNITHVWKVDITKTIRIDAGATITLFADARDNQEIINIDETGKPISVGGVSVTEPYNGQFIQMDVVSVALSPYALTTIPGSPNSALSFSGSQYATVPDAASLRPASLTLEAWFEQESSNAAYNSILGKGIKSSWWDAYTIWYQSSRLRAGAAAGGAWKEISVPWTPDIGKWHHVAFSFDDNTKLETLYVDGVPVTCGVANGAIQHDTTPLLLGGDTENSSPFGFWAGSLDEIRMFNTARAPVEILADMYQHDITGQGAVTGLVAQWLFDEGTGQVCKDTSGTVNDGVLGPTTSVETTDPTWVTSAAP